MLSSKECVPFLLLLFVQFFIHCATSSDATARSWRRKRHFGNGLRNVHGFEMFSMLDVPQKSLRKYSADPVHGVIYSQHDLSHTNGILTDRDVIEYSNTKKTNEEMPSQKDMINRGVTRMNARKKVAVVLPRTQESIGSKIRKKFLHRMKAKELVKKSTGKNIINGIESKSKVASKKSNPKNALNLNFITDVHDDSKKGIQTVLQRKNLLPLYVKIPKQKIVYDTRILGRNYKRKFGLPKEKISRSPAGRSMPFGDLLTKTLDAISRKKKKSTGPGKISGLPSERDFFFFRDAFEYGSKFLARKFSFDKVPDTLASKEEHNSVSPDKGPSKWTSDFDKIRDEVKENFAKEMKKLKTETVSSDKLEPTKNPVTNTVKVKLMSRTTGRKSTLTSDDVQTKLSEVNATTKAANSGSHDDKREALYQPTNAKSLHIITTTIVQKIKDSLDFQKMQTEPTQLSNLSSTVIPAMKKEKTTQIPKTTSRKTTTPSVLSTIASTTPATTAEETMNTIIQTSATTRRNVATTTSKSKIALSPLRAEKISLVEKKKVVVDSKLSNKLKTDKEIPKSHNRVTRVFKSDITPRVFKIPEWRMPHFFYRRPCPSKVDAMFKGHSNTIYAIDGEFVYVLNRHGVESGPLPVKFVWPHIDAPINAGFVRLNDQRTILFFGDKYVAYANNRDLVKSPANIEAFGLPDQLAQMDAVAPWTGNGRTYFFKGDRYWKYNDFYNTLETGYPRQIQRYWHRVPANVDTAFLAPNSYTYFIKDGLIYKMNYYRASVQYRYPRRLSESCYDFFM